MSGPPAKVTQAELVVRAALDRGDQAPSPLARSQQAESRSSDVLLRFVRAPARAAAIAEALVVKGIKENLAAPELIAEYVREYHRMARELRGRRRPVAATSKSGWAASTARFQSRSTFCWLRRRAGPCGIGWRPWKSSVMRSRRTLRPSPRPRSSFIPTRRTPTTTR